MGLCSSSPLFAWREKTEYWYKSSNLVTLLANTTSRQGRMERSKRWSENPQSTERVFTTAVYSSGLSLEHLSHLYLVCKLENIPHCLRNAFSEALSSEVTLSKPLMPWLGDTNLQKITLFSAIASICSSRGRCSHGAQSPNQPAVGCDLMVTACRESLLSNTHKTRTPARAGRIELSPLKHF